MALWHKGANHLLQCQHLTLECRFSVLAVLLSAELLTVLCLVLCLLLEVGVWRRAVTALVGALLLKSNTGGALRGGAVVKVLALHARDPIWAPVLSRQPRFPSSSLPVARESSRGRPKALGHCTRVGDLEEAPGFGLA